MQENLIVSNDIEDADTLPIDLIQDTPDQLANINFPLGHLLWQNNPQQRKLHPLWKKMQEYEFARTCVNINIPLKNEV